MKRGRATAIALVVVLLMVGAGFGTWLLVRQPGPRWPQISAYTNGHLTRVGPYRYCKVLNLDDCYTPETIGELRANERYPVQLSVPEAISRAPWRLLLTYEDPRDITESLFRPKTRLAVTIPTVDPHRGKVTGIVVQLLTLVGTPDGEVIEYPHAEWSVRLAF
ncbi:hypothetical protein BST27_10805 [Mycobacterium intermedium]|uniref:DUF2771 domain-containing protein n=1 Tax=Mycobacterium intermedium TaxID=28445 RepID=A0A1T3W992_MYCIE|nr:DUF2771 domain-containing protein [Mycobacterium intermedium]MCV6967798.1 DUF2771 domain-containing protein [Mycobacterium intermedium]OPE50851.1 hypothetical protein BV508_08795 [Mycobacterium intermedium]ORB06570.1 hypothetical protein BST27_10805 [Mycobacterium intermedium]